MPLASVLGCGISLYLIKEQLYYFVDHVIGGPGAFVIAAESYETFADAILKKLIREMAANELRPNTGQVVTQPPEALSMRLVERVARGKHPPLGR